MAFGEELIAAVKERTEELWVKICEKYGPSPLEGGNINIGVIFWHTWPKVVSVFIAGPDTDLKTILREEVGLDINARREVDHIIFVNLPKLFEITGTRESLDGFGFSAEAIYRALIENLDMFLVEELYHLWEWSRGELTDFAPADLEETALVESVEAVVKHYSYGAEYRALKAVVGITGKRSDLLKVVEENLAKNPKP